MHELFNDQRPERVLIVGLELDKRSEIGIDSAMQELGELVKAAEGVMVSSVIQRKDKIDATFFIGKGKAEEIAVYCEELDIDTVVFNNELSGAQVRNLEEIIQRKIIDRTNLILDIFARRATTKEGKLQVELAQLRYRLPRLIGYNNHLSRAGAGIGTRGPGEKKLETDRRHILETINDIERQLKELENVRMVKRKKRQSSELPIIALVGYTNAGKSTLLNNLIKRDDEYNSEKEVFAYNMLFATLETTLRRSMLPNGQYFLITDTVGFVSKLPTRLVEAFKGTLEEVKYADLLIHVVDVTNEDLDIQIKTTLSVLKDLDSLDKPTITAFNKVDNAEQQEVVYDIDGPKVFISAKEDINIDLLLKMVQENLPHKYYNVDILIPYSESNLSSYIFDNSKVEKFEYIQEGTLISTTLDSVDYERYKKYIVE